MKNNKREESSIVMHFMFYFILIIWLSIFTFINIVPNIQAIEEDKTKTLNAYTDLLRITKSWLSFDEFKANIWTWATDVYLSKIIKNISSEFYNKNLVNTKELTYKKFLESKKIDLNSNENNLLLEESLKDIEKLLPTYSDNSIEYWNNPLTDYKFINYVESIIETFNLSSDSSLWITNVNLVDEFSVNVKKWESLESNLYYIPLKLVLKWTKTDFIDFIDFIENVGNMKIENDEIVLNKYISWNSWVVKVLEWDKYTKNYNFYEHQIIDISSIFIKEYLDWSYISKWDTDFFEFIKNTQWKQKYTFTVDLKFYVKWVPIYKVEEFIQKIIDRYNELNKLVKKSLVNTKISRWERINLTKINSTLKQIDKDIINLKKELRKKEKIEELYIQALKIDSIIVPILNKLNK